ncbi:MAG: Dabb family protein [Bacteroidota bacterium]|nr:Dabb family protein [Bacteroidota bacterium]
MRKISILCLGLLASIFLRAQQEKKELRHVVLFGWEWGVNNSPENLNQELTYCFLVTFTSEKDRNDYLVNPDHKAFTQLLPGIMKKVTVFDYWAQP